MSEAQKRIFYGIADQSLREIVANFAALTGSANCARELAEASDYVETLCGPQAAYTKMSSWKN
jgi:hypothetical protein